MTNGNQVVQISRGFVLGSLVLSILTLVTQIIGLATNGWWLAYNASYINSRRLYSYRIDVGLWTIKYCLNDTCAELSNEDFWNKYNIFKYAVITDVTEFRVETCLGAAFMLIVVVSAFGLMCFKMSSLDYARSARILAVQCVFSVFSAIMALTAAGRVGKANYDTHNILQNISPLGVPYSVYITGVGGILAVILFIVLAIKFVINLNKARTEGQDHQMTMETYPPRGLQRARHQERSYRQNSYY